MRIRKLFAVVLALGCLADVHCRIACAGLPVRPSVAPAHEKACHGGESEPQKQESKPCCMAEASQAALLPASAPTLAPAAAHDLPRVAPHAAAVADTQALRSYRNHGPPKVPAEVLLSPSQGSRAPPAVL